MVKNLPVVGNVEDHQVSLLAGFERAQSIRAPQRGRGIEGQGGQRLGRQQPHLRAGHGAGQRQVFTRARPRVAIAGQRHDHTALNQPAGRCILHTEEECRRQNLRRLELSTSELQPAAIELYRQAGYRLLHEAVAEQASNKTLGGGIRRFYFEKIL